MMKLAIPLVVMLITGVASAAPVSGSVSVEKALDGLSGWTFRVELKQEVFPLITIGTELVTSCANYTVAKAGFWPTFAPLQQGYDFYVEAQAGGGVAIRISDWCDHWLTQSGVSDSEDRMGLNIVLRYNF